MVSEARQHYLASGDYVDEPPSWDALKRRHRTRVRLLIGIVVAAAIAAGVLAMVVSAAGHYERGRQAMAARHFGAAVEEFAAARILTFPYRDATALREQAQLELELDAANADVERQQRAALANLLRTAADKLEARAPDAVVAALREARILVPEGPLATTSGQIVMATRLASSLTAAGREALRGGHWGQAGTYGAALLLLDPADDGGLNLADRSRTATRLQDDLDAARAAARHGRWREALRLARAVLHRWPGFPGAAAVVTSARVALAPKPTPSATAAPAPAPTAARRRRRRRRRRRPNHPPHHPHDEEVAHGTSRRCEDELGRAGRRTDGAGRRALGRGGRAVADPDPSLARHGQGDRHRGVPARRRGAGGGRLQGGPEPQRRRQLAAART